MKRQKPNPLIRRVAFQVIESLERRCLLAAPQILDLPFAPDNVPVGKSIFIPIATNDADNDAVTYTVSVTGPDGADAAAEFLPGGNRWLQMNVAGFGTMTYQLFDNIAPETTRRIGGLADTGFYDNLQIFRIVDDFVFQFGSPTNDGISGPPGKPDFEFDDEFDPDVLFTGDGQLAMANRGKDTNSSQFFVTEGPQRFLDGNHTIFGQLVRGFQVRDAIMNVPVDGQTPVNPPVVTGVSTVDNPQDGVLRFIADTAGQYNVTVTATDIGGLSDTRTFTVTTVPDQIDSPPVLLPFDVHHVTEPGQVLVFDVPAADPEGDPLEYRVTLTGDQDGTVTVDEAQQRVTYTPGSGFTGLATILVEVRQEGATSRGSTSDPWDKQRVTVGVGDQMPSGSTHSLIALRNLQLSNVVVATFTDPNPNNTADHWTALIDWADGDVTEGTVVAGDTPGTFHVLGTHQYDRELTNLPVEVTLVGAQGARVRMLGQIDVLRLGVIDTATGFLRINGTSGADVITVGINGASYRATVNGTFEDFPIAQIGLVEIYGYEGDDDIRLAPEMPGSRIFGGPGNDTLVGGLGNDEIYGQDGNDHIDGHGGNDYLDGGAGDDYIMGGTGIEYDAETRAAGFFNRDTLIGGPGNDTLSGGSDANFLDASGGGNNLLNGSGSRDTLIGGPGNDTLRGWGNADLLISGAGNNLLIGDSLDHPERGGEQWGGNDTLEAGGGNNRMLGVWGNNLFRSGAGADTMIGGPGTDTVEDYDEEKGDLIEDIEIVNP